MALMLLAENDDEPRLSSNDSLRSAVGAALGAALEEREYEKQPICAK